MNADEAAALAVIRGRYQDPVVYNGAGLDSAAIFAIFSERAAPAFQGPGDTAREVSFEIEQSALPERPRKGNTITDVATGITWRVIEPTERNDIGAWVLVVEE
ncbi:hypothetical protein ACFB49_42550 [Sphingomonas sp. DBB INV C78]|uniref:head-tail joining protein n=1 Tax=Sphingomonas sp. DBB INV C78 TaxID=3349434 RepID=UPI0036D2D59A